MMTNAPLCPTCHAPLTREPLRNGRVGLTARMRETFDAYKLFQSKMGYTPTFGQMAFMLGQGSKSGVHRLVKALEARGWLQQRSGHAQSIVLREEALP
jgi:SOS-response transcriptional repressor LexA